MLIDDTDLTNSPLQPEALNKAQTERLIRERSRYATELVTTGILDGTLHLTTLYGVMGGRKTGTLADIVSGLRSNSRSVHIYQPKGINRGGLNDDQVWRRDGEAITGNVAGADSLLPIISNIKSRVIEPGAVISLVEAQFIDSDPDNIAAFLDIAKQMQHPVIVDALGSWFDGLPVGVCGDYIQRSNLAIPFQGWDDLDHSRFADCTLRLVGITPNGDVIDPHTEDTYYRGLTQPERIDLVNKVREVYQDRLLLNNPDGYQGVCYGLPSYTRDARFAPGAGRYRSASIDNWRQLYDFTGTPITTNVQPIKEVFSGENILNWQTVGFD
ncbi:MAG: hypothetical protein QY330_00285 [Candidatus Dojkabacteria bacterium]|nr:hypothetical protein [Candidatus Dojkabacteria bacterium]WKZ28032.1 MAG: hypothetical protein QY330_00285 [Candidatus Dojkabacteria bacterium]